MRLHLKLKISDKAVRAKPCINFVRDTSALCSSTWHPFQAGLIFFLVAFFF